MTSLDVPALSWENPYDTLRIMVKNTIEDPLILLSVADLITVGVGYEKSGPKVLTDWNEIPDWLKKLVNPKRRLYQLSQKSEILRILSGTYFKQHKHLTVRVCPVLAKSDTLPVSISFDKPNSILLVYEDCTKHNHRGYWVPPEYRLAILGSYQQESIRHKKLFVLHAHNPTKLILFRQGSSRKLPTPEYLAILPELYQLWKLMTVLVRKDN